ncbi:hepatic triacylglycerol lipase-like [Alosa sapidissima]|uniref:hepatic triacylglycerol lipase-like n=1 Tax=Alosa sapidissima TaxID=34773 RepID=UPI001C089806|nr:hepatic triacylglycerol lipase-like [Alosa sapidissima]
MGVSSTLLLCGLLLIWGSADTLNGGGRSEAQSRLAEEVQTRFSVYRDGDSVDSLCAVTPLQEESLQSCSFNSSNPLVLIVHGWSLDGVMEDWVVRLAWALKAHLGEVNVLVCNWIPLAQRFYPVAARNARLVGQEVALLLEWLEDTAHISLRKVHLVGYSLGAHVAGFAGQFFNGSRRLGRITGLDPAGPMFEGMPAADRLSPDDAMFVDAIHTFTKSHVVLSVGIRQTVGHLDFYPNGGTLQPGCYLSDHISQHGLRGLSQAMKCAHERSVNLFIDSLLHEDQQITAFRCRDNGAFSQGLCLDCKRSRCSALGYGTHRGHSGTNKRFYLRTRSHMPYRVYHYQLRVQLVDQMKQSWASASVTLRGLQGESQELPLHLPSELSGNKTLSFLVTVESGMGQLEGLTLRWGPQGVLADMWQRMRTIMPWGGQQGQVLSVGRVRIKAGETQDKMWFCSAFQSDGVTRLQPWTDYTFDRCHTYTRQPKKSVSLLPLKPQRRLLQAALVHYTPPLAAAHAATTTNQEHPNDGMVEGTNQACPDDDVHDVMSQSGASR